MGTKKEAKQALGQLFITGFSGLELSTETTQFLSDADIGGVILFSHNYENPAQVAELINQVQEIGHDLPYWISVDQEGGKVQRFKKGFTRIPEASVLSAQNSPQLVFEVSKIIAQELKAVGVNLNFCPVADINTNPKNPVIGSRSFGNNADTVSKMVTAMVRGHLLKGVQPCVKHFPGHGDTSTDSHFSLPKIDTSMETLKSREILPFIKAFKSHCSFVMTSHILNSQIDPKLPATLCPQVITDLLRKQLRYKGIITTDDMEMKAIADHFGVEDAPRLAIEAGCDHLIYRSEAATRIAYEGLVKAIENGTLNPDRVLESAQRIQEFKKEFLLPYEPVVIAEIGTQIGLDEHQELIQRLSTKA